jgi:hypothetical protein
VRATRVTRPLRELRVGLAVAAAVVLVAGVAVAPSTVRTVVQASYSPVTCLDHWVTEQRAAGRHPVGVGQFWTVRPLAAYADRDVHLLQVRDTFDAYPWLVDLGSYRGARPDFVVIGSGDVWGTPVEDSLGSPATITHCSGYDLYDYAGTAGAAVLRQRVVGSAEAILRQRGF